MIAALAPLIAKATRGELIDAEVAAIAATFPTSPYAADVQAGEVGLMVPTAALGMLSAIVIPLVMDYTHATRGTEADVQLDALEVRAKAYFHAHDQAFPTGSVALTPSVACCDQGSRMCAPDARGPRRADAGHRDRRPRDRPVVQQRRAGRAPGPAPRRDRQRDPALVV